MEYDYYRNKCLGLKRPNSIGVGKASRWLSHTCSASSADLWCSPYQRPSKVWLHLSEQWRSCVLPPAPSSKPVISTHCVPWSTKGENPSEGKSVFTSVQMSQILGHQTLGCRLDFPQLQSGTNRLMFVINVSLLQCETGALLTSWNSS